MKKIICLFFILQAGTCFSQNTDTLNLDVYSLTLVKKGHEIPDKESISDFNSWWTRSVDYPVQRKEMADLLRKNYLFFTGLKRETIKALFGNPDVSEAPSDTYFLEVDSKGNPKRSGPKLIFRYSRNHVTGVTN